MERVTKMSQDIEKRIYAEIIGEVGNFTPKQADDYRLLLVTWYQQKSDEAAKIEVARASEWLAIKSNCKTNTEAEMLYDNSEHGRQRIALQYELKSIEKMISALKDRMQRLNNEAFNRY